MPSGTVSADGRYLLTSGLAGVSEFSVPDHKCISLAPELSTLVVHFSADGKSILYFAPGRGEGTIYRQPWHDGKLTGARSARTQDPVLISHRLFRKCLRLLQRSFHRRLRSPQRPSRPLPFEVKPYEAGGPPAGWFEVGSPEAAENAQRPGQNPLGNLSYAPRS